MNDSIASLAKGCDLGSKHLLPFKDKALPVLVEFFDLAAQPRIRSLEIGLEARVFPNELAEQLFTLLRFSKKGCLGISDRSLRRSYLYRRLRTGGLLGIDASFKVALIWSVVIVDGSDCRLALVLRLHSYLRQALIELQESILNRSLTFLLRYDPSPQGDQPCNCKFA